MTPSEWLVMEILSARYRLGEPLWTFHKQHKRQIVALQKRGLVDWKRSTAPDLILVWLTRQGFLEWGLDKVYISPYTVS